MLDHLQASAFLPYLVLQSGKSLDAIRADTHAVFRLVCGTYPSSKLFVFVLEGLKSKNAKQRTECLLELADMVERQGLTVAGSLGVARSTQAIANQVSDRDKGVRNAALDCLVTIFNIVGDDVFKLIGSIGDKDESLVVERIKRCGRHGMAPPEPAAPTGRSPVRTKTHRVAPSSSNRGQEERPSRSATHDVEAPRRVDPGVKQEFSLSAEVFVQRTPFNGTQLELAPTDIDFDDESDPVAALDNRSRRRGSVSGDDDLSARTQSGASEAGGQSYVDTIVSGLVSQVPVQAINALKAAEDEVNTDPSWMTANVNQILEACTQQAR